MSSSSIVHVSDLHFGRDLDLAQVRALRDLVPSLDPKVIVVSGDLTQRARYGELQAGLAFVDDLRRVAPTLVVPGNHDVQWWASPFGLLGSRPLYRKYREIFGETLSPALELPGLVVASALTAHGVAWGSLTWKFWRDTAVKGHLPAAELARAAARLAQGHADDLKVLVVHHNVLRGEISRRMGLAHWRRAHVAIAASGAELVLCGHDHQENAQRLAEGVVVATASTHTSRVRGDRSAAFNVITFDRDEIAVVHQVWDEDGRRFRPEPPKRFRRSVGR